MPSLKSIDRDDIEIYFSHFSHACNLNDIPHGDRSKLLINKLPVHLSSIVDRMSLTDAADIDKVQTAVFSKFLLDAEYFKSKFYSLSQMEGESSSQYFQRLREILIKWLASEGVPETYKDLVDFLLKNQYMRKLNTQKTIFIRERNPVDLEDLCKISDTYDKANLISKPYRSYLQNNPHLGHSQPVQSTQSQFAMVIENSCVDKSETEAANVETANLNGQEISLLELNCDESKIMAAYNVNNLNHDEDRADILNPYTQAVILPDCIQIRAMRDTGSFVSVIKSSLVPENAYTSRQIKFKFANGSVDAYPTAIIEIRSKFFDGKLEAAVMTDPVCDLILGNQANIKTCFDSMPQSPHINFDTPEIQKQNRVKTPKKIVVTEIKTQDSTSKVERAAELLEHEQKIQNKIPISFLENTKISNNDNFVSKTSIYIPKSEFSVDNSIDCSKLEVSPGQAHSGKSESKTHSLAEDHRVQADNEHTEPSSHLVPIGAIMTRARTKSTSEGKLPTLLTDVESLSVEQVKSFQRSDLSLIKYWELAEGKRVRDKTYPDLFVIKNDFLYRRNYSSKGLYEAGHSH